MATLFSWYADYLELVDGAEIRLVKKLEKAKVHMRKVGYGDVAQQGSFVFTERECNLGKAVNPAAVLYVEQTSVLSHKPSDGYGLVELF